MNHARKIGIVGGGQLGKMMAISAKKMGMDVVVTDPTLDSPAGQVSDMQIVADYKDANSIKKLSKLVDVITFEIELANDKVLLELIKKGIPVHPHPDTLSIIRDKFLQKKFLNKYKISTADSYEVHSEDDIIRISKKVGFPFLLKARTDAYDGRGNYVVGSMHDIKKGLEKLKGRALYVEKFVPFVKELAVMIARTADGKIEAYPIVETIHKNNICDTVIIPARVSSIARNRALSLSKKVVKNFKGAGVFGVEMFLTKNNNVLINEIAPRVHNSGHYTIEACVTSQFEQHIRAVSGLPLGSTELTSKFSIMKNILGTRNGDGFPDGLEKALKIPNVSIHMYGKKESRSARKMGHITVTGNSLSECLKKAEKARRLLVI